MTKDQLITRLTHELYDLKHKLEDIRLHAETAQFNLRKQYDESYNVDVGIALRKVTDILNLVDVSEEYFTND